MARSLRGHHRLGLTSRPSSRAELLPPVPLARKGKDMQRCLHLSSFQGHHSPSNTDILCSRQHSLQFFNKDNKARLVVSRQHVSTATPDSRTPPVVYYHFHSFNHHRLQSPETSNVANPLDPPLAWTVIGATAAAALVVLATSAMVNTALLETRPQDPASLLSKDDRYRIEVDLMDKLADKPYLHLTPVDDENRRRRPPESRASSSSSSVTSPASALTRPPGIPPTLRILAVDIPELSQVGFSNGICQPAWDRAYPAGVAPPKKLLMTEGRHRLGHAPATNEHKPPNSNEKEVSNHHQHSEIPLEVEQKAWVRSMFQCVQQRSTPGASGQLLRPPHRMGVQVMQASMEELNARHLRKIHPILTAASSSTSSSQPPLESSTGSSKLSSTSPAVPSASNQLSPPAGQKAQGPAQESTTPTSPIKYRVGDSITLEEELEAPWNQYAWMDEMELRIAGRVLFGAPMQPASWWDRRLWGHVYGRTVPSNRSWWSLWGGDPQGVDGGFASNTWASHRPHVVIANGAALQQVPRSLLLLQRACQEHDVPLFVIRDPRSWGAHHESDDDLGPVLAEIRRTVKRRLVISSLQHSIGTAFQRGKRVGRWEADLAWEAKEALRLGQDAIRQAEQALRQRRDKDWRQLDGNALEEKLVQRGVIHREEALNKEVVKRYSNGFVSLAKDWMSDQKLGLPATNTHTDHTKENDSHLN